MEITTEKQIEELKWEPGRTDLPTTPPVPPPPSLPDADERMRDGTPVKEEKEASPVEQPAVNSVHVTAAKTEDPVSSVQLPIDISNDPTTKSPVIEAVDAQANGILHKTILTDIIMTSPVTEDIAMNPVSPLGPPPLDTGSEVPIQKQTSPISDAVPPSQITSPSLLITEKVLESVDVNMAEEVSL